MTVVNLAAVTIVTTIFLWIFGSCLNKYWWLLVIILIATPIVVYRILKRYEYNEFRRKRREQKLRETHEKQIRELIRTQDRLLYETESKASKQIYSAAINHEFDKAGDLYSELNKYYKKLALLRKIHEAKLNPVSVDVNMKKAINMYVEQKALDRFLPDYPELKVIDQDLRLIYESLKSGKEVIEVEHTYLQDIRYIASDKQLMIVIRSDPSFTQVYNMLVDLYDYFKKKHEELNETQQKEIDTEREFSLDFGKLGTDADLMPKIRPNPHFVSIYNHLFDLDKHYKQRIALFERIMELRKREKAEAAISGNKT
jgi:hypothetical protein